MNIIPEEPEVYIEIPRPTPGLNNLLTTKQFNYYITANTSQLFGYLNRNLRKQVLTTVQTESKVMSKKLPNALEINKKSLFFLGMGFGILAITKVIKNLTK